MSVRTQAQFTFDTGEGRPIRWEDGELSIPEHLKRSFDPHTIVQVSGAYEHGFEQPRVFFAHRIYAVATPLQRLHSALSILCRDRHDMEARALSTRVLPHLEEEERACFQVCLDAIDGDAASAKLAFEQVSEKKAEEWGEQSPVYRLLVERLGTTGMTSLSIEQKQRHADRVRAMTQMTASGTRFFGGPSVTPHAPALNAWLDATFDRFANERAGAELRRVRTMDHDERCEWLAAVRHEDEVEYDLAYEQMVEEFYRDDRNAEDSPPDDVGFDRREDGLVAQWCVMTIEAHEGRAWRPQKVASVLQRFARHGPDAHTYKNAVEAAMILSATDSELAPRVQRVAFVLQAGLSTFVFVRLRDSSCLMRASEGVVGAWAILRGEDSELVAQLPETERPAAELALSRRSGPPLLLNPDRPPVPQSKERAAFRARKGIKSTERSVAQRWVVHPRFGRGVVMTSEEGPRGLKLRIEFENGVGLKQVLESSVKASS